MRVSFIIDSLAMGGAQKHLRQLALGLIERGHRVDVISLNDVSHPAMTEPMVHAGVRLAPIGRRAMLFGGGFFRLIRHLREQQPDLVVTVLFASTVAGRLAAKLTGGWDVVTCIQARNVNYRWWQFLLLRSTAGCSSRFIFNSRSAVPFACKHEGATLERCFYIANGIEQSRKAGPSGASFKEYGLPFKTGDEIIGSIGRLDPQKGFTDLLRAFVTVQQQRPRARLLLVGAGIQEPELRRLTDDLGLAAWVFLAGERSDCERLLKLMTVYVQPSVFEGTPNALMEAMSAGVPSIASSVDGAREIIEHGINGWLVPPRDSDALSATLVAVLDQPDHLQKVAASGQRDMAERFPVNRMIEGYLNIFREIGTMRSAVGREKA